METEYQIKVTVQEFNTIIAALRRWQGGLISGLDMRDEMAIAEDAGDALSIAGIDTLVDKLFES